MIGEATYIACRCKQQLLPSTKQELPTWIYVRGKVQFKSMCCLEGIECVSDLYIPRIGLSIWLQQSRQTDSGNI